MDSLSGDALIAKADEIAERAHRGQTDRLGQPYIQHPRRVGERVATPEAKAAAVLHDVIEDSGITTDDLRAHGIPTDVVDCVARLTRDVPDDDYYRRIRSDDLALFVKLADLADNSDTARLGRVAEPKQSQFRAKYRKAYTSLGRDDLARTL
jgi:(p)ppGpp synthase/HD superfamily hydrolase